MTLIDLNLFKAIKGHVSCYISNVFIIVDCIGIL